MRLGSMLGVFVAASMGLAACSSASDTTTQGATSSSASGSSSSSGGIATCNDLAKVACDKIAMCAPWLVDVQFGSVAHCAERLALSVCVQAADESLDVAACAAAYAPLSCDVLFGGGDAPAACLPKNQAADGAACDDGGACKSGVCSRQNDALCGTCQPVIAEGGDCAMATCASGLRCLSATHQCTKPKATGEACASSDECASSLVCAGGKCGKAPVEGEACSNELACDLFSDGLFCSPTTMKCQKFLIVELGAACGYDMASGNYSVCKASDCIQGTCVARIKDGDACVIGPDQPSCDESAHCVMGKCTLPTAGMCK